jgi:hypothetical protein
MICPALIAAGDLWSLVVPIVFFIIYALNHLLGAKGNRPPARNPQRRPPPERAEHPPQPLGQPADPMTGDPSQLNAEIEQFLRRATERRGDRSGRERAGSVKPPPKAPQKPLRDTRREQPVDVVPIERPQLSSVSASVEKHLTERDRGFTSRAEHLADDIVRADQQMEDHLQKAFSHRVGTLPDTAPKASTTPATDTVPQVVAGISPVAAGVIAILSDPKNLRQAVVLSEILDRPEHRW